MLLTSLSFVFLHDDSIGNHFIYHFIPSTEPNRIVKNPMSISKIKSRIRSGEVSTFADMKRDVLMMFANSLMFNSRVSAVHQGEKMPAQLFSYG